MNNTPHPREMRRFFYDEVSRAVIQHAGTGERRMSVRVTIPELNPEMDVYRVGTLLELVREMATQLAEDGRRVKVCVQASMGQGVFQAVPLSLSGVARIMSAMDWGEVGEFVSFGAISAADVTDDADIYLLLCPQNIVGNTIIRSLTEMADAVESGGKTIVLINPILKDVPSANGVMGVKGRAERLKFDASFSVAYHFRLLYFAGSLYPIQAALRFSSGGKWQLFKRVDLGRAQEEYQLWGEFESEPDGAAITTCLQKRLPLSERGAVAAKAEAKAWWK